MQSLFVRQTGRTGPLVVLVHGLGASGRHSRPLVEKLAGEARSIRPDLLGFGRSPRPAAAYSIADHLTALDGVLERLSPREERVILAGQSAGAVLALERAAVRPEQFAGVLLVALPAYRTEDEARSSIAALSPLAWATVARPGLGELVKGLVGARLLHEAAQPLGEGDRPAPHKPPLLYVQAEGFLHPGSERVGDDRRQLCGGGTAAATTGALHDRCRPDG